MSGKRRSRLVLLLVLAVAVAAGFAWLLRDLPRLRTRSMLASSLAADVGLGRLEMRGRGTFVLHDLVIERPAAAPWVRRLELAEVLVEGQLGELRSGLLRRVVVRGGTAQLEPIATGQGGAAGDGDGLSVGELEIAGLEVIFHALGQQSRAMVSGELSGALADPRGELELVGDSMRLLPLVAFVVGEERLEPILARSRLELDTPYPDVRATVTLAPGEPIRLRASGGGELALDQRVRLPFPDLAVVIERAPGSFTPQQVAVDIGLRRVGEIALSLVRDGDRLQLRHAELEARRSDVVLRAFDLLPAGWEVSGPGSLRLVQRSDDPALYAYSVSGALSRLALPFGETRLVATDSQLAAEGTVHLDRLDRPTPLSLRWVIPELQRQDGDLPSALRQLEIDFVGSFAAGGRLELRGATTVSTASLGTLVSDGLLAFGDPAEVDLAWQWRDASVESLVALAEELGVESPLTQASGRLVAEGRLTGSLTAPTMAGFLQTDALTLQIATEDGSTMLLTDASLATHLRLSAGELRFTDTRLAGRVSGAGLEDQAVAFSGAGSFDPAAQRLRLTTSSLELAGIGRLVLAGSWSPEQGLIGSADLPAVDPALFDRFLAPALDSLVPEGWRSTLDPDVELSLEVAAGRWRMEGTLTLDDVELASLDGSRVIQVADSVWRVDGSGPLRTDPDSADRTASASRPSESRLVATSRLPGFVVLWGGLYADYGELAAAARVELSTSPGEDGERRWGGRVELVPDPALRFAASFLQSPGEPLAYDASLAASDLATVFDRFVRLPLADSVEALGGVSAAGRAEITVAGSLTEVGRTAVGELRTEDLDLAIEARELRLSDLDLAVPIDLEWGPEIDGARSLTGGAGSGSLRFAGLEMGEISVGSIETDLVVVADRLELERPLELSLLGGRLRLERLALAELTRPTRELRTSLFLERLDLGQIARRFGLELSGELSGSFPDVRVTGDEFEVEGGGEVAVFGGTVTVSEISGEEVFSDLPKLQLDAQMEGIHLEELTRSFDFGQVSGVARGYVHHLVLFGGTPVRFDGEIETVRTPGVPRRITLKAIENISILGTGGLPGGLSSTLLQIFDRYRYAKIGAHLTLSNDVFLMRGLAERGDKELFMKGRFPPLRIDIVNASPGRTVSFSTMLERLKYADFSRGDDDPPGWPTPPPAAAASDLPID